MSDVNSAAAPRPGTGRMVLLLIAGIPVMVILASSWLWYFVVRGDLDLVAVLGTANRGTLLQPPRQLEELGLVDQSGAAFTFPPAEAKWTLLVPQRSRVCAEACERRLYLVRQIHIAMGKEIGRLRRVLVAPESVSDMALQVAVLSGGGEAPPTFAGYLRAQQRGLRALQAPATAIDTLFPEIASAPDTWYLVDPAGWVMMAYNESVGYKDVIADLKFLLKNSNG